MALTRPKYSNIVDGDYKNSCRVATTTNINLISAPLTYDGVTFSKGDRVLVTAQNTGSQNGIYIVLDEGTGSNGTWTRSFDSNDGTRLSGGSQTSTGEGSYAGAIWRLVTPDPIVIGTTPLVWATGSAFAGGANKQVQYNDNGVLAGTPIIQIDEITGNVVIGVGAVQLDSNNSNYGSAVVVGGLAVQKGVSIATHLNVETGPVYANSLNTANARITGGSITGVTGWGVAYLPQIENITGLTDSYSVAFFSRHTQTFYQPYLLTNYDDLIQDDRNLFLKSQENKLFLYIYQNGDLVNLDADPFVRIEDRNGDAVTGMASLTTCLRTKGVYEVVVPNGFTSYPTPCQFYDVWSGLTINGQGIPNVTNQFTLQQYNAGIQIGPLSKEPSKFGFSFYGILQNEQILNTDIRKVGVTIKKAYTGQQLLENVSSFYRVYVKEGTTEVQVQDWTPINRTPNEFYFIFDMRDKIPNQYYVDIQVNTSGEKDTYKKQLTFNIVNTKQS